MDSVPFDQEKRVAILGDVGPGRTRTRRLFRAVAPESLARRRDRRHRAQVRARLGVDAVAQTFFEHNGGTVLGGPFQGLEYPRVELSTVDAPVAKLLGVYEREISSFVTDALDSADLFVDVGAAEGYYAVGAARRLPSLQVIAFEVDRAERRRCARLAAFNGVANRVRLRGVCTARELGSMPLDRAFILSDCEGAEFEIFEPDVVARCRSSTVIAELHGVLAADALTERFAATHTIEIIEESPRDPAQFPRLANFARREAQLALTELRVQRGVWGIFRPKTSS